MMAGFNTKVRGGEEYEITFYTSDLGEYLQVQELCRSIIDGRKLKRKPKRRCDTCQHEKEPWSMQCHRCENYNLWEGKQ